MFTFQFADQNGHHDERNDALVDAALVARVDRRTGPMVGDWVRFADDTLRRISYHWRDDEGWDGGCQTSDAGSYHLHDSGNVSMSGGLFPCVPTDELRETDETLPGHVWIFHHGFARAHSGVHYLADFPVWTIDREPPR